MMRPDLHMHSTYSDGVLAPALLVERAASTGVTAMAITDHDTFEGVDTLQGVSTAIPVIPGVELSLKDMHGLHLLGYGLTAAPELRRTVADLAAKRLTRAQTMVSRLASMGMPLNWHAMTAGYSGTLGRAHIARALLEQGYVLSLQEAFDKYLGEGKPAYAAGERLSMAEALPLMRRSGFVPVLAHPALLGKDDLTLRTLIAHWQSQGLMGVEVYHPTLLGRTAALEHMVRSMGLLVTGGSDFHKDGDGHGAPGCICQEWAEAPQDMARLMDALQKEKFAQM
ncbi:MAG: PHP domain-containing protein [Clostridia bacterium]|nr:PHP domain-containing protein [Clostridia bacterium]